MTGDGQTADGSHLAELTRIELTDCDGIAVCSAND